MVCSEEPPQANSSSFQDLRGEAVSHKNTVLNKKILQRHITLQERRLQRATMKLNHRFLSKQVYFTCVDTQRLNTDSTV